jgi:epoxyqueuosine reductase
MKELSEKIKQEAKRLGFDLVGITTAEPLDDSYRENFQKWVQNECPPRLSYLQRNLEKRFNPSALLKDARSVIVVGLSYKPGDYNLQKGGDSPGCGYVSIYACYPDYHRFIKDRLFRLAEFIQNQTGKRGRFKACVDSAPLAERTLAVKAGLGGIGKNRMLINPSLGGSIFLGELLTDIALTADKPDPNLNLCGNCRKCIESCPTCALQNDGGFRAEKCINYLTIEHKGNIDDDIASKIGCRVFGCDNCVTVCPFYKKAPGDTNPDFVFRQERQLISPLEILEMNNSEFKEKFGETCIYRTGLDVLKRNARICLENKK